MKVSAGVLLYRRTLPADQVLLVHPGGPFWRNKDRGAWQIPKGEIEPGEEAATAALREAREELGILLPHGLVPLGTVRQAGGKIVHGFALEQDLDAAAIRSNAVTREWPARSGAQVTFPEVDAARWMDLGEARGMMLPSQLPLLDRLEALLSR